MFSSTDSMDSIYYKKSKQNTINEGITTQWQASLRRTNRKNNINARSVWYDDRKDVEDTGYPMRKASSLDSLLVEKKSVKRKITKDLISAPMDLRKIGEDWKNIKGMNFSCIVEEQLASSDYSLNKKSEGIENNTSGDSSNEEDSASDLENSVYSAIRNKDAKYTFDSNRRGNILPYLDAINTNFKQYDEFLAKVEAKQQFVKTDIQKTLVSTSISKRLSDSTTTANTLTDGDEDTTVISKATTDIGIPSVEIVITEDSVDANCNNIAFEQNNYRESVSVNVASDDRCVIVKNTPTEVDGKCESNMITENHLIDDNKHANAVNEEIIVIENLPIVSDIETQTLNFISVDDSGSVMGNIVSDTVTDQNAADIPVEGAVDTSIEPAVDIHLEDAVDIPLEGAADISVHNVIDMPVQNVIVSEIDLKYMPNERGKKMNLKFKKKKNTGSNLIKMKFMSKSSATLSPSAFGSRSGPADYDEVLRTLQTNKDEPLSRSVGPFPRTDDSFIAEDVQLRSPRLDSSLRQSKTIDFDPRRNHNKNVTFDVRGCVKIQLPESGIIHKLKKNEYLQYQNNSIIKSDDTRSEVLKFGLTLKSARLTNKKEVELKDLNNQTYNLTFDSSKDAKLFIESDRVSPLTDIEKSTITRTLLRLLGKRSSREVLEKKGIYQNEPIFGNTLKNIYSAENGVPKFISKTMDLIERPDNITSLGLYRTSGNLATIQKIRLEVDKGNLDILDMYAKDPDVLTGSLKLFFRELKEPLLSCKTCDNLLEFTKSDKYCKKDKDNIRTILIHIPEANSETLMALIRHLLEIIKYKEQNKMDTYNLAVCWGPTIIFATDNVNTKDLVTQSAEATKLFDSLLNFYLNNPEEMDLRKKKNDHLDTNRNMILRQDSKDSIHSSDSGVSSKNKSSSNLSLDAIDEVLKKSVELIEVHLDSDGIYKKSGSAEKTNKIFKKMTKRKLSDLDKYRNDVYELTDALKKYLKEGCDSLVNKDIVEHVNKICDNTQWLEHNTRHKVVTIVMDVPKKDTLIFLIRHLIKLIKNETFHNVSKAEMFTIWAKILNDQHRVVDTDDKMIHFLKIMVDVFDETKSDIVNMMPKGMSNGLLNDLKNLQKEKDRISKYDNVPDDVEHFLMKEATIMEEKTEEPENTKL